MIRGLSGHSLLRLRCRPWPLVTTGAQSPVSPVTCDPAIVITILSMTHLLRSCCTAEKWLGLCKWYYFRILMQDKVCNSVIKAMCGADIMKLPSTLLQNFAPCTQGRVTHLNSNLENWQSSKHELIMISEIQSLTENIEGVCCVAVIVEFSIKLSYFVME